MSTKTTQKIDITCLHGAKQKYITPCELKYYTRYGKIIVPKAFLFDGDSGVPDLNINSACLHDYLYYTGILQKHKADIVFRDIMLDYDLYITGNIYYVGVVLFGYYSWNNNRRKGNSLLTISNVILDNFKDYILPDATWLVSDIKPA